MGVDFSVGVDRRTQSQITVLLPSLFLGTGGGTSYTSGSVDVAGGGKLNPDDRPRSFGMLIPQGDTLHIWCGYGAFLMDEGFRHAREIAKAGGASKISFESLRPGWQKVAAKYGFKPIKFMTEV